MSKKLSQPRGISVGMTIKFNMLSWMGFWDRKRSLEKNQEN